MKHLLKSIILAALVFSTPAFAIDPHDSKSVAVRNYSIVTATTPETNTIASVTTSDVGSGTNSYQIYADITFEVPSGNQVSFEITIDGTIQADSVTQVANQGHISIHIAKESVAASKVIAIKAVARNATTPIAVKLARLTVIGLDGATQ